MQKLNDSYAPFLLYHFPGSNINFNHTPYIPHITTSSDYTGSFDGKLKNGHISLHEQKITNKRNCHSQDSILLHTLPMHFRNAEAYGVWLID